MDITIRTRFSHLFFLYIPDVFEKIINVFENIIVKKAFESG